MAWKTANRWAERYRTHGHAGMSDRSSRPHHSPTKTAPKQVRAIVRDRMRLHLGPIEIGVRRGMPASTVHRVLTRAGLHRLTHVDRLGETIAALDTPAEPGSVLVVNDWQVVQIGHRNDAEREIALGIAERRREQRRSRSQGGHA